MQSIITRHQSAAMIILVTMLACTFTMTSGCKEQPASRQQADSSKKAEAPKTITPDIPLGLEDAKLHIPDDNPMTEAKVELGKMLYFDKRLSKDKSLSCATCHDPQMAWAEHKPVSEGVHGQKGDRNANTVINTVFFDQLFWDGRADSLEEQALGPITNPIEMGMDSMETAIANIQEVPEYQERFKAVFGDEGITEETIAKAIATFERTILSGNSPYDQYVVNDKKDALTESQQRGLKLFEDAGCSTCHKPPTFSNGNFYNTGIGMDKENPDPGLKKVTGDDSDFGKFRVPHLREIEHTYPYYHDGSVGTLQDAVTLMARGGIDNDNLSIMLKAVREAKLTDKDIEDLTAFLKALSGEYPKMDAPELP